MVDAVSAMRVLVVDDSPTSCIVIAKQLQKLGYATDAASTGMQAIELLQTQQQYHLMLLDCFMPDMDGFEVVQWLRQQEKTSYLHLPVIGITGETDISHQQRCLDSGMDGILEKPISENALKRVMYLWCPHDLIDQAEVIPAPKISQGALHVLFYETTLVDIAALKNAITQNDLSLCRRLLHRMKGAALTLNKLDIAHLVTEMENTLKNCTISVRSCDLPISTLETLLSSADPASV